MARGTTRARAALVVVTLLAVLGMLASPPAQAAPGKQAWTAVSAGLENACGIHRDATLWCWGAGQFLVNGDGTSADRPSPVQVMRGSRFRQVSAGWIYTCALRVDGSAWCWGWNDRGQLGDGTTVNSASPRRVLAPAGVRFRSLATSRLFATTCGVDTHTRLWCWGLDQATNENVLTPRRLGVGAGWQSVSVGGFQACGLRHGGRLSCFTVATAGTSPRDVEPAMRWRTVSVADALCAVRVDGRLFCGGADVGGEAGGTPGEDRPFQPVDGHTWRSVSTGSYKTCGVRSDGTAWCWGDVRYPGDLAQTGTATDWTTVSVIGQSCGLRRDGSAWCWSGYAGTLGDGSTEQDPDPTSAHRVSWTRPQPCRPHAA